MQGIEPLTRRNKACVGRGDTCEASEGGQVAQLRVGTFQMDMVTVIRLAGNITPRSIKAPL